MYLTLPLSAPMQGAEDDPPPVEIVYYTDPLCCWSWAMEPQWRRLLRECDGQVRRRYRMGGMIANWGSFADPVNSIHRPGHVGAYWYFVRQTTDVVLDERLWVEDPPESSYPACLAFKAAERQGHAVADRFLRQLRQAAMTERRNIARREVLLALARESSEPGDGKPTLDLPQFVADLDAPATLEAFREDLRETRYRGIGRFPTFTMHGPGGRGVMLVGYRPYDTLHEALARVRQHLPHGEEAET